jgi:hypothetical protein
MPNNLYPSTSPYYQSDITNNQYLDVMINRPIPKLASDVFYTLPIVYEFRPDLLAYDLYGDSRLWWVFAARNPNTLGNDPYFDFVAGIQIYIPNMNTLKQALGF